MQVTMLEIFTIQVIQVILQQLTKVLKFNLWIRCENLHDGKAFTRKRISVARKALTYLKRRTKTHNRYKNGAIIE